MTDSKLLLKGGVKVLLINCIGAGLTYLSHIILARYLSIDSYGVYAYCLAWVSIMTLLALLGQGTSTVRFLAEYIERNQWGLVRGAQLFKTGVVIVSSSVLILVGSVVICSDIFFESSELKSALFIALFVVMGGAILTQRISILQAYEKLTRGRFVSEIIRPFCLIVAVVVTSYYLPLKADTIMGLNFGVIVFSLIIVAYLIRTAQPPEVNTYAHVYNSKEWFSVSIPLLFVGVIQILLIQIDVILVGHLLGVSESGLYAPAARTATLVAFPVIALRARLAPMVSRLYTSGNMVEVEKLLVISSMVGGVMATLIGSVLWVFSDSFLIMFGPAFVASSDVLTILVLGHVIASVIGPNEVILLMTKNQRVMVGLLLFVLVVNLVLNFLLIPVFGTMGAAISTAISASTLAAMSAAFVIKFHKVSPFRWRKYFNLSGNRL